MRDSGRSRMEPVTLASSPPYVGLLVQLGAELMLVALFALLRGYVVRRPYFSAWTMAWGAATVGVAAIALRYTLPAVFRIPLAEGEPLTRALYYLYQAGKLVSLALLVSGTRVYAHGGRADQLSRAAIGVALLLTLISVGLSDELSTILVWQAVPTVLALGYCAVTMLTLPPLRRSLGSVATGSGFAAVALLWTGYFAAYLLMPRGQLGNGFLAVLASYNSYFDLLANVLLGYGMVVLLMQDAKREVDDAHAELAVAHDELKRSALYDSLTNSLNRVAFTQGIGTELARGTFGTVVMIDLDNLKTVNDNFGHATGDRLIRHVADLLRTGLRASDRLYRWGGDEFLLLLPGARSSDVRKRFEGMIAQAESLGVEGTSHRIPVEASVGVYDYATADDLPDAIGWADAAMYTAKVRRKGAGAAGRQQAREVSRKAAV